ncbi:hypothetical protein [Nocardia asiatica]|uniref:hypothetical protein n=1 Tax=Nocardia asiatica TaxID=209252 RepID=UPI002458BC00|nr:hypothetical protein [Nocardia asiatica]
MTAPVPPDFVYLQRAETLIHALRPGVEFVNADIYSRMKAAGWPDMSEPRQFGPMLMRLRREGVIEKAGVLATTARSHGGVASVWRRTQLVKETS